MSQYHYIRLYSDSTRSSYLIQSTRELGGDDVCKLSMIIGQDTRVHLNDSLHDNFVEKGPKLSMCSEWGSNAKAILWKCGLTFINRIEKYERGPREYMLIDFDPMTESIYDTLLQSFEFVGGEGNTRFPIDVKLIPCNPKALKEYSDTHGLNLTDEDVTWYYKMWKSQKRKNVTELELHDLAQSNSEHSRHHVFRGDMILNNFTGFFSRKSKHSLFDLVKLPLEKLQSKKGEKDNSVLAFCDNSSAIKGFNTCHLLRTCPHEISSKYDLKDVKTNTLFTAETHNFPTGIAPFPGAATGTGGRIRDVQAIGRGGAFIAGTAGYCVGSLGIDCLKDIENPLPCDEYLHSGVDILIKASNGASDYGNKIGEPLIQGFTRSFGANVNNKRLEWIKPIMFTSGIGIVYDEHLHKQPAQTGMLIGRVGGPAYRIGVGGGTASSTNQETSQSDQYQSSVQRGDPEMEQKMDRFIRACIEMGERNPIVSIHDQGAGGMCNVTKEIVDNKDGSMGAIIDIRKVVCGDETMTLKELWIAEYQEQNTFLCSIKDVDILKRIAHREGVPLVFVGNVTNDGLFTVHDTLNMENPRPVVEFKMKDLKGFPKKTYNLPYIEPHSEKSSSKLVSFNATNDIRKMLYNVLKHPSVCSKRFLTNKVDRSVSGLIAQQQCVGPLHTPLADVAIITHSHFRLHGAATAIGEKPITGISCPDKMARMAVGEMVTNIMWVKCNGLSSIKCSGNWMWPAAENSEKRKMMICAHSLSDTLIDLDLAIDGGKDSLSMSSTTKKTNQKVDCPPQIVISGYTSIDDVTKKVTPDIKQGGNALLHINISNKHRLGGSVLVQTLHAESGTAGLFANDYPDLDDCKKLQSLFDVVQSLIESNLILSGHDVSDGGLIVCVFEMAFAGNKGLKLNIDTSDVFCSDNRFKTSRCMSMLFAEELGCVIEVPYSKLTQTKHIIELSNLHYQYIGYTTDENQIHVKIDSETIIDECLNTLRDVWESTSFELERLQSNEETVQQERDYLLSCKPGSSNTNKHSSFIPERVWESLYGDNCNTNGGLYKNLPNKPNIAIIREEGSNGDREMCAAFWSVGFDVYDLVTSDFCDEKVDIKNFNGIVFVGGFTFSDVFGAAKGWESIIKCNDRINKQFEWYYSDKNTNKFSLGVCNGCQLMCRMGWVGSPFMGDQSPPVPSLNNSGRFESRFCEVTIDESELSGKCIMLQGMQGVTLPVWVAHAEGKFGNDDSKMDQNSEMLFPIRYTNSIYPLNPNGSAYNIAGACSQNGLHLAMMPHPERTTKSWQHPWYPQEWQRKIDATYDGVSMPWTKMFLNAYTFSINNK